MYGVDMARPGAQEYYDSVFRLFAGWGLDFVKVDDLSYPYHQAEIEGIRKAIDRCGHPIVFSTSPGEPPLKDGAHVAQNANMWRISGEGHWPDADMLPVGNVRAMERSSWTRFTPDEQFTMLTLWCIARSPLMIGGHLPKNDAFTLSLLTNEEVLAVNRNSAGNRQLFLTKTAAAWVASVPGTKDLTLAVFNLSDPPASGDAGPGQPVPVNLAELGFEGGYRVRDLWQKKDLGKMPSPFAPVIPGHGAGLYRLTPDR